MNPTKNPSGVSSKLRAHTLIVMAAGSSCFLFLLFHLLINCSPGFAAASSTVELRVLPTGGRVHSLTGASSQPVDLFLSENQVNNLISSETSTVSWLKSRVLDEKRIRSIAGRPGLSISGPIELQNLQHALETVSRVISSFGSKHGVKLSMAFPLPYLENLAEGNARELFKAIERSASTVIIEAELDDDQNKGDWLLQSIVKRAIPMIAPLPTNCFRVVFTIQGSSAPVELSRLRQKILEILRNEKSKINGKIVEVMYSRESTSAPSRRELLNSNHLKSTVHDTVFPVAPIPTYVTVPGTAGSATVTPTNPTFTPVVFPPPASVTFPAPSVTGPVTPVPVTNPVTTFPSPPGTPGITPVTAPATNPPATPSTSPAIPGQSWCVAKVGATEAALQAALDYACGIGGADCSQIQMGASCYNPNTIQGHASYAFNSYYQRNPVATSCDFGGTATVVATNPSTGSCVYPTYSQNSAPATTTPTTPATPTPTTESMSPPSIGAVPVPVPGSGTPPAALNTGTPASGNPTDFGLGGPPPPATPVSTSSSAGLQPYVGCVILIVSLIFQDLCCRART